MAYSMDSTWINLDDFKKVDSATSPETDFKKTGVYASRFKVVNTAGQIPTKAEFKDRPFRVVDDMHIGIKVTAGSKEVNVATNPNEDKLDDVPGNQMLVSISDGVVLVQRFEGKLGYKISKYDEWGKPRFKQTIPHTNIVETKGDDFMAPYLYYFTHTDRFMVFTSLNSHDIHKTVVMDLKDGKLNPIEATICGAIRAPNELSYNGYMIRDEARKILNIKYGAITIPLKENNITKVVGEALVSDTLLVIARYYKGMPGINLSAFNNKTGKLVWAAGAEVRQPAAPPNIIYLSLYKNKLLMEGSQGGGNYLEAFDINTGKRLYSTL